MKNKKLTKDDGMRIFGVFVTLCTGLWALWHSEIPNESLVTHIKLIYTLLLVVAISISTYYIIFKLENKKRKRMIRRKNVKRK